MDLENENELNVLSSELSRDLKVEDDLLRVGKNVTNNEWSDDQACSTSSVLPNVAQCPAHKECSGVTAESQMEHDEDSDEEYWTQTRLAPKREKNLKERQQNIPRKKQKDYNIISNRNATPRLPSYFKFDKSTTSLLEKFMENKLLGEYHSHVGKGTDSVVIHAHCYGKYHVYFPSGNAVKVYKLKNDLEKNNNIFTRVLKEYSNLELLRNKHFGNNFPHPVHKDRNIIIMSFIGTDYETAPSISSIPAELSEETYHLIVNEVDSWYKKLKLVHGNLSSKSVLYYENRPFFIGWSHSVRTDHPKALKKLMMDCHFVTKFFQNRDVPVKSPDMLFKDITGFDKINSKLMDVICNRDLWKDHHQANPNRSEAMSRPLGKDRFK